MQQLYGMSLCILITGTLTYSFVSEVCVCFLVCVLERQREKESKRGSKQAGD